MSEKTGFTGVAEAVVGGVIVIILGMAGGAYWLTAAVVKGNAAALLLWQMILMGLAFVAVLALVLVVGFVLVNLIKARGEAAHISQEQLMAQFVQLQQVRQLEAKIEAEQAKAAYQLVRVDQAKGRLAPPAAETAGDDLAMEEIAVIGAMFGE